MSPPDNRIAICPGSYDPVTYGHLDVISRAAAMFDQVIAAVVNVPIRKGQTVFSTDERVAFVESATRELGNVTVEPFSILVVEFAQERGAKAIVKGLRAISDFEYELEMNQLVGAGQTSRTSLRLPHSVQRHNRRRERLERSRG